MSMKTFIVPFHFTTPLSLQASNRTCPDFNFTDPLNSKLDAKNAVQLFDLRKQ